jgi:hypothetical protein
VLVVGVAELSSLHHDNVVMATMSAKMSRAARRETRRLPPANKIGAARLSMLKLITAPWIECTIFAPIRHTHRAGLRN